MLAIRLQRVGRKGYATYRVIVQDAQLSPSSGRIVAYVGSYNPHTKATTLDKEIIEKYLSTGAQPSDHVIKLLQEAKIKLPSWVKVPKLDAKKAIRNPEKLRRNRPAEAPTPEVATEGGEPTTEPAGATETAKPAETPEEPAQETASPAEETVEETPEEKPTTEEEKPQGEDK